MEIKQQRHYAAIASILPLAGVFIHPVAVILIPVIIYIFYSWRQYLFARLVALRAADLAFSIQLFLILADILLIALSWVQPMTEAKAQSINTTVTLSAVAYMALSLIIGTIQAFRCVPYQHILSLKIGERILGKS